MSASGALDSRIHGSRLCWANKRHAPSAAAAAQTSHDAAPAGDWPLVVRKFAETLCSDAGSSVNVAALRPLLDKKEYVDSYKQLGIVYREIFGGHYPAMTAVQVSSLIEDAARVEIEVTAVIPD